jgi:hypothetical protein
MSTNKKFAIADLVTRLESIADDNRYDQVSRTMHEVYEKRMASSPDSVVTASDVRDVFSNVSNLNPASNFTDNLDEVFGDEGETGVITEGSPFRVAGWEEDYRPTPTEVYKTEEEIVKDASFGMLKKVASGSVVNPQYHFSQFVNVPSAGPNAGVALWSIAFNTKRGTANISVPVNIVNGGVHTPEVFYVSGHLKGIPFTAENLKAFASEYKPADKEASTELSGFDQIGQMSVITDRQDIKEANVSDEDQSVSVGYTTSIEDSLISDVGSTGEAFMKALEATRNYVEKKVKQGSNNKNMNMNIQVKYSGAMDMAGEKMDPSVENVKGVFAFNATQNTRNGLKTITIPVVFADNQMEAPSFHTEKGEAPLSADNVNDYFTSESAEAPLAASTSDPTDAFSEAFTAFLKSEATYGQILAEVEAAVKGNNLLKAASFLEIINNRFGADALTQASTEFYSFVKSARDSNKKELTSSYFPAGVDLTA